MSRIFISHSHVDNATALALGAWLDERGWTDYYLDIDNTRGMIPGERWVAALMQAVERCEAVLFLVSPAWRDSKYCFAEFLKAKELGKRIFGVIIQPIALSDLPSQMTSEWQVCDLSFDEDPVAFTVAQAPIVPATVVRFPRPGLDRLGRGLRSAGLDALSFAWPPKNQPDRSPYRGLSALDEPDAAVFFGRDAAIVRAVDHLRLVRDRGVERLYVILGASGAGKSSFLRAGLLPRLRRDSDHFTVLPTLRCERAALTGQEGLLASLRDAIRAGGRTVTLADVRTELAATGLLALLRRIEYDGRDGGKEGGAAPRTVVVPVDQFEELFAADGGDEARALLEMFESVAVPSKAPTATRGATLQVLIVVTIRSDSLPLLQSDPALRAIAPVLMSLPTMPASEFKSVIEGPARRHSESVRPVSVDPALAEVLIADSQGADALPLLGLTLELLYIESDNAVAVHLSLDQYRAIGGVRGVIGNAVARALALPTHAPAIPEAKDDQTRLLERVFPYLATVDPDTRQTKRRVALRSAIRGESAGADALISRLVQQRLLVADSRRMGESDEPVEVIEVAHEALLRQWDLLDNWLRARVVDLAAIESVRREALVWQQNDRHDDLLLHTRDRLRRAQVLLTEVAFQRTLEPVCKAYLDACAQRDAHVLQDREDQLQRVAAQQALRARWQRRFTWGLAVFALVAVGLGGWIFQQTRNLGQQKSLLLASQAEVAADRNHFDQAVRLAVLASDSTWLAPAHVSALPALARAADGNRLRRSLEGGPHRPHSAAFSADGKRVVTASYDKTARVWDAESGKPVGEPMAHKSAVKSAAFSPDGKRVVTASYDGTARVWDAESGRPVGEPMAHKSVVNFAAFSPDG